MPPPMVKQFNAQDMKYPSKIIFLTMHLTPTDGVKEGQWLATPIRHLGGGTNNGPLRYICTYDVLPPADKPHLPTETKVYDEQIGKPYSIPWHPAGKHEDSPKGVKGRVATTPERLDADRVTLLAYLGEKVQAQYLAVQDLFSSVTAMQVGLLSNLCPLPVLCAGGKVRFTGSKEHPEVPEIEGREGYALHLFEGGTVAVYVEGLDLFTNRRADTLTVLPMHYSEDPHYQWHDAQQRLALAVVMKGKYERACGTVEEMGTYALYIDYHAKVMREAEHQSNHWVRIINAMEALAKSGAV